MRRTVFQIPSFILVLVLMSLLPGKINANDNEKLTEYYKEYIFKCVCKNESKSYLKKSRSEKLRKCWMIYEKKASFLKNNQSVLIDEMIKKEIGRKPYKIDYYLNKKFHETVN